MRITIDKNTLYDLYITRNLTSGEIGKKYGKNKWWVLYYVKKYNIPMKPKGAAYNKIDLTNKRFGNYFIVGPERNSKNELVWKCKCDCGNERIVGGTALTRNQAKSCGECQLTYNWRGCGELSGCYFNATKKGAERRKIFFDIKIQDLWDLFIKQNRKCALSGQQLTFVSDYRLKGKLHQTASIDRIDSSKGYTIDNIQWIHKKINFMKQRMSNKEFIETCKLITNNFTNPCAQ